MIVDSTLECVHTYPTAIREVNIIPGRNAIPDDVGRLLMANKGFQDMINSKAVGFVGKLVVVVPPAPAPGEASAEAKPDKKAGKVSAPAPAIDPDKGECATSNMTLAAAIKLVRELEIVEQIQDIMLKDPRQEVKAAAESRITELAQKALQENPAAEGGAGG